MAPLRSLGNILSAFDDFYARTGKDAAAAAAVASGGTKYVYGSKTLHAFTSSDTFQAFEALNIDVLAIGGGGGTGGSPGGAGSAGGGGGGFIFQPAKPISAGTYTVVIGAGGDATTGNYTTGGDGGNSSFGPPSTAAFPTHLIAVGGGGGGNYPPSGNGNAGGSSGGGGPNHGATAYTGSRTARRRSCRAPRGPPWRSCSRRWHASGPS